jgi:hypothetical protein
MSEVFVDTVGWLALANKADGLHEAAQAWMLSHRDSSVTLVTSELVLVEFLNAMAHTSGRLIAAGFAARVLASSETVVEPMSHAEFVQALALYAARTDKGWSLVDCASIVTCEQRGITRVLTSDHHFEQAGLEVLLRLT